MRVLLAVSALAVAFAAAPVAAAPGVGIVSGSPVFHHSFPGGERQALWRDQGGDHDLWRHHHRHDFFGPVGPVVGEAVEPGPVPAPSPFVVAAPVFVNVTFTPAVGPQRDWTDGPKLIEIGRRAPPRGHLPLVVYGD